MLRGQFYLTEVLSKISNYNSSFVSSALAYTEGYGAILHSADRSFIEELKTDILKKDIISEYRTSKGFNKDGNYEFILDLEGGILNCNQPLMSNTEVKLSFDRCLAAIGLLYENWGEDQNGNDIVQPTDLDNKVLDLTDPYMEVEYISSPYLRNFYAQIIERPMTMRYDDCDVYMKSLPEGQTSFRWTNIMGGNTPDYIFGGFMSTASLQGDFNESTSFRNMALTEANVSLNGMPVQGYPINGMLLTPGYTSSAKLYVKFLDTIGRSKKTMGGQFLSSDVWETYYNLISHKFEGEQSNEGWISIEAKFKEPTTYDTTFGMLPKALFDLISLFLILLYSSDVCNSKQCSYVGQVP